LSALKGRRVSADDFLAPIARALTAAFDLELTPAPHGFTKAPELAVVL
jgi:hypothetical protein